MRRVVPFLGIAMFVVAWQIAAWATHATLVPGPFAAIAAIGELARRGLLIKYIVASLFRVTWGYFGAVIIGIPAGVALGLWRRGEIAVNPFLQILRPISPLAWIPIAILWFGVGDVSAIFLIFLASLLPLVVTAMQAVHNIESVHLRAGANFGLS
ncbi:MAG TPA: ABC transporter permease, partial [Thermoanaerobaculia bacterium]